MYIKVEGVEKLLDEALENEKEIYFHKIKQMRDNGLFEGVSPNKVYAMIVSEAVENCIESMSGKPAVAIKSLIILSVICISTGYAFARLENDGPQV